MDQTFTRTEFELVLTNRWKAIGTMLSGVAATIVLAAVLIKLTRPFQPSDDSSFGAVVLMVPLAGIWYGFYQLTKKVSAEPTVVVIDADKLLIENKQANTERTILFTDISTYRHYAYNGAEELRFKLTDGSVQKLSVGNMHNDHGFASMVDCFEAASQARAASGKGSVPLRQKTFFEKRISTLLLVPVSIAMGYILWAVFVQGKLVNGSLYTSLGGFIAYLAAWYAAREKRRG